MDEFIITRKRQKIMMPLVQQDERQHHHQHTTTTTTVGFSSTAFKEEEEEEEEGGDSTDLKLAMLASLFPDMEPATLLDVLLGADGSVDQAREVLSFPTTCSPRRKKPRHGIGYQTSLAAFKQQPPSSFSSATSAAAGTKNALTKKGQTLHLYAPEDIEAHTPCSIIHNFLPVDVAEDLLRELLDEAPTFERQVFKMFDNVVQSPHSACFYVESLEERRRQQTEYLYNGHYLTVRHSPDNAADARIQEHYPGGKKLKYQSSKEWVPNAAFVNCYRGGSESVGYHCDQLTYLGPRAVIGSLSLGVAREFRVRKIVARSELEVNAKSPSNQATGTERADAEGQIAIHLPHNSLLVMHAEMQEEW
ncbi:MAG: hypothetical protein Q9185_001663 [Variospora sp. 1 TL-2023]